MNTPTIITDRLILRKFTEQDLEALFLILKDEEVNKFLPWYPMKNIEEASIPVPTPLLGHRCRSSREITGSPTPFSTSNHYLWICPRASFSLSNPNIAA
jgi:RimJ/RimL family protein N-acetyltransferase